MNVKETIILDCKDSDFIEQAIFILKPKAQKKEGRGDAVAEAERIIYEYRIKNEASFEENIKKKRRERKIKRIKNFIVFLLFAVAAIGGAAVAFGSAI